MHWMQHHPYCLIPHAGHSRFEGVRPRAYHKSGGPFFLFGWFPPRENPGRSTCGRSTKFAVRRLRLMSRCAIPQLGPLYDALRADPLERALTAGVVRQGAAGQFPLLARSRSGHRPCRSPESCEGVEQFDRHTSETDTRRSIGMNVPPIHRGPVSCPRSFDGPY